MQAGHRVICGEPDRLRDVFGRCRERGAHERRNASASEALKPSTAVLLAVYAATSGKGASVALDVTFTIVPERCSRRHGISA